MSHCVYSMYGVGTTRKLAGKNSNWIFTIYSFMPGNIPNGSKVHVQSGVFRSPATVVFWSVSSFCEGLLNLYCYVGAKYLFLECIIKNLITTNKNFCVSR